MAKDVISLFNQKWLERPAASFLIPAASLILLFLALAAGCAAASPSVSWDISPSSPYVGDTLVVTGTAAPGAELAAGVSYKKTVFASGWEYEYKLDEVDVPAGKNSRFTVSAEGVENLRVQVKKIVWLPPFSKDAVNGSATISKSRVPAMTYGVKMYGQALEEKSRVYLTITASQTITADAEGNFTYKYDTGTMPAGKYIITIGGISKTIFLKNKTPGGRSDSHSETIIKPSEQDEALQGNASDRLDEGIESGSFKNLEIGVGNGKNNNSTGTEIPKEKGLFFGVSPLAIGIILSLLAVILIPKFKN